MKKEPIKYTFRINHFNRYLVLIFCLSLLISYVTLNIILIFFELDDFIEKILYDLSITIILTFLIGFLLIIIQGRLYSSKKIEIVQTFIKLKKYQEAENLILDLLKDLYNPSKLINLLGRIELEKLNLDNSQKDTIFEKSWDLFQQANFLSNNKDPGILNNISLWYLEKGDIENCSKVNHTVLKKRPKNIIANYRKINILEEKKDYEEIYNYFKKHINIFLKDLIIYSTCLTYFYDAGKKLKKTDMVEFLIQKTPKKNNFPFELLYNLGLIYYQEERINSLKDIYMKIETKKLHLKLTPKQEKNINLWKGALK